jgi:hypothetical protein
MSPTAAIALAKEMSVADHAATDMPRQFSSEGAWLQRMPVEPYSHTQMKVEARQASQSTVRVAIYSDEPILATGFQSVIAADPELQLTACCGTINQLKEQLASGSPDVAVVDFTKEITAASLAELWSLAAQCKLILWTNSIEGDLARRALKFGIRGVLRKTLPLEAHRQCLHRVNSGQLWFEGQLSDSVN